MNIISKTLLFCCALVTSFLAKAQVVTLSGALSTFVTCAGTASATQSFTVGGTLLTGNISITAVPGFEISTIPGSGFAGNLSLSPVGGAVNAIPIFVRIASSAAGSLSGNITCSSTGAVVRTIAVNGVVKQLPDITPVTNQQVCHNSATAPINFTSTGGLGTIYNWNNNNSSIGLAATGSGNIPSFTAVNTGNTPVTATVSITASIPAVGPRAYIPLSATNFFSALAVIDLASNTVLTTFSMAPHPAGICPSPDGSRVYITNRLSNLVSILNPIDNSIIGTIGVGSDPIFVKPSPDGSRLYVSNTTSNSVSVINTATSSVIATIPVGIWPMGIAVSPDGTKVYVATRDSYDVKVINALTNTVITTIPTGASAIAVALTPDGSKLYVTGQTSDQITVVNTATNLMAGTIPVGSGPTGLAMNHAGTRLYVTNQLANTLSVINVATNAVIATIPTTGLIPFGVSVSPDDSRIYVTHINSNNVVVMDAANYTIIATIPMAGNAFGLGNLINPGTGPVCTGPPKNFTITVNPTPVANAVPDQNLCNGVLSQAVNFSGGAAGTTYNWVNSNANIGLPANGTGNIAPFTAVNNTAAPITALITVTPISNGCSGIPKNFSIIVGPSVNNVTVNNIPAEVCLNDAAINLTAVPSGGIWTGNGISGNSFSPATAGIGTATLTYSVTNSSGCTSSASVNVTVKNCADSIAEFCRLIRVEPNPSKGQFGVKVLTSRLKTFNVRIIAASGVVVRKYQFTNPVVYGTTMPFNLGHLPNGAYILEMFTDVEKCTYRVVILR
jgi:YVTN family beta-propeller protein